MKRVIFMSFMALFMVSSLTSCRDQPEQTEKERTIEKMQNEGADIDVSRDGDKIKMETDDKKVKIKTDNDGDVKIKEKDKSDNN